MTEALSSHAAAGATRGYARAPLPHGLLARAKLIASGALAAFLGLLPHALHHAGPLAGAALFAGSGGSVLFGAIGLVVAIPFLLRLHRRTGGWRIPGGVLALMVAMFSLSTLVIGPKIAGGDSSTGSDLPGSAKAAPGPKGPSADESAAEGRPPAQSGHEAHH